MSHAGFLGLRASFWFVAFVVSTSICFFLGTMMFWGERDVAVISSSDHCAKHPGTILLSVPNVSAANHASLPPTISDGIDVAAGAALDPDQEALANALALIKVGPKQICSVFATALSKQGVMSLHDLHSVVEADARDLMARAGMSKLQQLKVMRATALPAQLEVNSSLHVPPPPATERASPTLYEFVGSSGTFPRMGHDEWKRFVTIQAHLTRNFSAAMYSRWTWYNYRSEWIKDDWKEYTPRAAEWDECMTGRQYCVASFGMYAYSPEKLEYYTQRALLLRNALEVFYPGWRMRIYYDEATVSQQNVNVMSDAGIDMILCGKSQGDVVGTIAGMFWRFYVANDPNVDRYLVRDLDSHMTWREKAAVDEWIRSQKPFHLMRDHHQHGTSILGGMWGGVKGKIPFSIKERALAEQHQAAAKGGDQYFLTDHVWPVFQQAGYIAHSSFISCEDPNRVPFPTRLLYRLDHAAEGNTPARSMPWFSTGESKPSHSKDISDWPDCPMICRPAGHSDWVWC